MRRARIAALLAALIASAAVFGLQATSASASRARTAQTIIFTSTPPSNPVVGGPTYLVMTTGGASGNPIRLSTSIPAVCSVTGSVVSFSGVGECVVLAQQAGNRHFLPAPEAEQVFAVPSPACGPSGPYCITSASSLSVPLGSFFSFLVTTSGNPFAKTFLIRGRLPKSVHIVNDHNGTATILGTPTASKNHSSLGSHNVTLWVVWRWREADGGGLKLVVTQRFTLTVTSARGASMRMGSALMHVHPPSRSV